MVKELNKVKTAKDIPQIKLWTEEIMDFMFSQSQETIVKNGTSDTGFLLQSGIPPFWENENTMAFGYTAPYAPDIEYGTPPHKVSGKRLIGWAHRKLGIPMDRAKSVAWAIAKKIERKGTDPQPFIRPSVADASAKYGLKVKPPAF